jgi:hypothetical protein
MEHDRTRLTGSQGHPRVLATVKMHQVVVVVNTNYSRRLTVSKIR